MALMHSVHGAAAAQQVTSTTRCRVRGGYACCQVGVLHTPQTRLSECQSSASGPGSGDVRPCEQCLQVVTQSDARSCIIANNNNEQ